PYTEIQSLMQNLGDYKLLYVAPERFTDPNFLQYLQTVKVSLFAIDEAHCISQWGHSFRPEYRQLSVLKKSFPQSVIVALTATATRDVENDILSQLAMHSPYVARASFDRPNLTFHVHYKSDPAGQLRAFLQKHSGKAGIIYAATRSTVDETYEALLKEGFKVERYHAGIPDAKRTAAQHNFIYGEVPIIVATVAFGMGIHKPDIRFIVHLDMPRSIEQYYQEVGRAGRDGLSAECLMLYSTKELMVYNFFLKQITDELVRKSTKAKTEKIYAFCKSSSCRRKGLLGYFGENYTPAKCNGCDNCLKSSETTQPISSYTRTGPADSLHYDRALFNALSDLRRKIAREAQVPAFVVFGDRALIEMSTLYPTTRDSFLEINGVGPVKWERYGESFLAVIVHHCEKSGITKPVR
ncbi:MAG: RecQ family ATP-dependent DNA helicase, partial [Chlamydiales bacterium]